MRFYFIVIQYKYKITANSLAGPALGLGQLGHCLGPLTREGPKFECKIFLFLFFIYKYFWEILKHFNLYIFFTIKKAQRIK